MDCGGTVAAVVNQTVEQSQQPLFKVGGVQKWSVIYGMMAQEESESWFAN